MRWFCIPIFLALAVMPAWADGFDPIDGGDVDVQGAFLFASGDPLPGEGLRRSAGFTAALAMDTAFDEIRTLPPIYRDRLDIVLNLLEGVDGRSPLARLAVAARRIQRILRPSENVRIRLKVDPMDGEYRATLRVHF